MSYERRNQSVCQWLGKAASKDAATVSRGVKLLEQVEKHVHYFTRKYLLAESDREQYDLKLPPYVTITFDKQQCQQRLFEEKAWRILWTKGADKVSLTEAEVKECCDVSGIPARWFGPTPTVSTLLNAKQHEAKLDKWGETILQFAQQHFARHYIPNVVKEHCEAGRNLFVTHAFRRLWSRFLDAQDQNVGTLFLADEEHAECIEYSLLPAHCFQSLEETGTHSET